MAQSLISKCSIRHSQSPKLSYPLSFSSSSTPPQFLSFKPRLPLFSFTAGLSSSSSPVTSPPLGGDADSTMDAVQRRLMFEDELVFLHPLVIFYLFIVLNLHLSALGPIGLVRFPQGGFPIFIGFPPPELVWCIGIMPSGDGYDPVVPLVARGYSSGPCILVDANDGVVGHDTKYNCKLDFALSISRVLLVFSTRVTIQTGSIFFF
ncbi:hypothetical protein Hdeb2414_s0016g00491651 [Helianthus debilis subsp. tardiflorus]